MKFGVLGPVQVAHGGRFLSHSGPKQRTVLALPIARAGESVSTDALMQGVYGADAPPGSHRSVQTYISNLRGEIGDVITATGSGYALTAERSEIDAFVFEDMVDGSSDDSNPEETSSRLREALALWRGHPFDGEPFPADVTDLDWSPDGNLLAATAGRSQRVIVWNTASGGIEFVTDRLGIYPFSSIQFSPDGSRLAASSKTGMWVFDTADWSEITTITHPGRPSWAMRFTPDGSEIVTAQAHRGILRIYDTSTWEERDISSGRGQTRDMAISENGRLVALANNIGLIHIIDIESEEIIETHPLPGTDITNVEFIDNDRRLLATDAFGPVEILTLDTNELIADARTRLSRSFTESGCATYNIEPCPSLAEIRNS